MDKRERLTLIQLALGKVSVDFMRQSKDVVMPTEALLKTAAQIEEIWAQEVAALEYQLTQYRWRRVEDEMPKAGTYVIAYYRNSYGKGRRIRAMYAAKHTLEQSPEAEMGGAEDYDEATDTYYVPPGWYECNEHEDVNWRVDEGEVIHWMPLPPAPGEGSSDEN